MNHGLDLHRPYNDLSQYHLTILW